MYLLCAEDNKKYTNIKSKSLFGAFRSKGIFVETRREGVKKTNSCGHVIVNKRGGGQNGGK